VDLFQPLADLLEGFAQPFFQRGVQFFVHHQAHLLQLGAVVLLQKPQLLFKRFTQFLEFLLVGLHQGCELAAHLLAGQPLVAMRLLAVPSHLVLQDSF
jgi:hypothetical protein